MNNNIKSQIYYFSSIYLRQELPQYKQQFLFIIFFPCSFIYQILNNFFCPTYLTYFHAYNSCFTLIYYLFKFFLQYYIFEVFWISMF